MARKARVAGGPPPAGAAPPAFSLVNAALRRFPWPADPRQRYSFESPYLAVVNARGPWSVWLHKSANPPFVPLCLDLWDKGFWRAADDGQRVFALTVWSRAAREDDWGIVWGDPVRLVHEWGLHAGTFIARLDWMIESGLAVYLTHAEAAAARDSWRYWDRHAWTRAQRAPAREGEGGSKRGEEQGQASSSQASQASQAQEQESSQVAGSARAHSGSQFPGSVAQAQEQEQEQDQEQNQEQAKQAQAKAEGEASRARQGEQPAQAGKLPESDSGSGHGGKPHARSRSVPSGSEAVRIGQILSAKQIAWQNPLAVDFARHLVGAITGRPCLEDLNTASDRLLMDLGPWVYYWVESVQHTLPAGKFQEFRDRCVRDIRKKARCRGVRNLGGVARSDIVPGVLAALAR